jgi:hypothetical protein
MPSHAAMQDLSSTFVHDSTDKERFTAHGARSPLFVCGMWNLDSRVVTRDHSGINSVFRFLIMSHIFTPASTLFNAFTLFYNNIIEKENKKIIGKVFKNIG